MGEADSSTKDKMEQDMEELRIVVVMGTYYMDPSSILSKIFISSTNDTHSLFGINFLKKI